MSRFDDYKHAMDMVKEVEQAGMMILGRERGTDGWVVDYKTLERITVKACQVEPVSMEGAEAVILALVDDHFARLEEE